MVGAVSSREVSHYDVEPGRLYRFTFRHPVVQGTRKRTVVASIGSSFWGEVPFKIGRRVIRIERSEVVRVVEIF